MPKLTAKQIQIFVVVGAMILAPMVAMLAVAAVVLIIDFWAGG